jgi:hypothetical protein
MITTELRCTSSARPTRESGLYRPRIVLTHSTGLADRGGDWTRIALDAGANWREYNNGLA